MEGPTIGILSPLMAGYYYGSLISAVNQAVSAAGGRLMAISTAPFSSGYRREHVIEDLPHLGWDPSRVSYIANAVSLEYLEKLREAGKPVVALGHAEPGFSYPAVQADNQGSIRAAVAHLWNTATLGLLLPVPCTGTTSASDMPPTRNHP